MKSLWNDQEAATYVGDLAQRVYSSRLLGRDPALVLHGGGNTSVKIRERNVFGEEEDILYVKGSGWDLATIEAEGFAPVRLGHLLRLAQLDALSDLAMARELKSQMTNPSAPAPSVEAILHASLPYPFVDHTHADALVTITNTPDGLERIQEVYGDSVVIIPYIMPGFKLARLCAQLFPARRGKHTIGIVLMNHGLFTFGDTARESYERMIELVDRAEQYLARQGVWQLARPEVAEPIGSVRHAIAALRSTIADAVGAPVIMATHRDPQSLAFACHPDVATISQQGPATPDHVLRTKRLSLIGRDVSAYCEEYKRYFAAHAPSTGQQLCMLDPAPRVILDAELGMCVVGATAKDAAIVEDIYRHTIEIVLRAAALGEYQALPPQDIFEVEYWDLEQAKLRRQGKPPAFMGEIGLVTGAASGIGRACVDALLARGAAVAGLDINSQIEQIYDRPDLLGLCCDITDEHALDRALEATVRTFGGLDMLILNAGIFPSSSPISSLSLEQWRKVMQVNLDANLSLMRMAYPLLKSAPRRGRVVLIGSKNVPAPGPGAAAYSASKAALTQLARVAALEWGSDGVRVNVIHPNAVFDTGIWTDEVLRTRAASYGMSVEQYKANNILRAEVTSHDVANMAAELCGPLFAKTTGAQIPVDGGNERVI